MKLTSGISKGQVLQRLSSKGANVTLTGSSSADGAIFASLYKGAMALKGWKKRPVGRAVRGKFSAQLSALPVGGPYRLRLDSGQEHLEIGPFFVGDVWVLAGQSNMEGIANMSGRAKPHPLVRAFSMRREWRLATDPLHVLAESPDICHTGIQCTVKAGEEIRRAAVKGVGPGVFFGREMFERSGGVPQGLIIAAHGGTSMQQWDPACEPHGVDSMYASMLASVKATGQPVAGLLWYQGESDSNAAASAVYTKRMKALVAATRRDFALPRLPWIIVQIGKFFTDQTDPRAWNEIQEQQRLLPGKIAHLETVASIDLSMDDGIHIGSAGYPRLATRLASAADRLVYRNPREPRGPQLRRIRRPDRKPAFALEIEFDVAPGGLQATGEPSGFQFVTDFGAPVDVIYRTELRGNLVKLHLIRSPLDHHLYYGHGFAPYGNITDARGFSLPVFGPIRIGSRLPRALLPFITQWKLTGVVPDTKKLNKVSLSEVKALEFSGKNYPEHGFISERQSWIGKSGQAFFHARIELSEPMVLEFLMGYDGPFRVWLNEQSFFIDMKGTNPCVVDARAKKAKLPPGLHDIHIGMDLNQGRAWGFYLRFARTDVSQGQIQTGQYTKPKHMQ